MASEASGHLHALHVYYRALSFLVTYFGKVNLKTIVFQYMNMTV